MIDPELKKLLEDIKKELEHIAETLEAVMVK